MIITDLGQRQKSAQMLKIQQIFLKLYRCLLYAVFHNLEPQNAELIDVRKEFKLKKIKGNFCARKSEKKISIIIKNIIGSEDTLMHKAERPSNYFSPNTFTHNQVEWIRLNCVQVLLEIHLN